MIQQQDNKAYKNLLQELNISMITGTEQEGKENFKSCHLEQVKSENNQKNREKIKKVSQIENLYFLWKGRNCLTGKNGILVFHQSSLNFTKTKIMVNSEDIKCCH